MLCYPLHYSFVSLEIRRQNEERLPPKHKCIRRGEEWMGMHSLNQKTQAKVTINSYSPIKTISSSNHVLNVVTILVRSLKS